MFEGRNGPWEKRFRTRFSPIPSPSTRSVRWDRHGRRRRRRRCGDRRNREVCPLASPESSPANPRPRELISSFSSITRYEITIIYEIRKQFTAVYCVFFFGPARARANTHNGNNNSFPLPSSFFPYYTHIHTYKNRSAQTMGLIVRNLNTFKLFFSPSLSLQRNSEQRQSCETVTF